ncbi:MAG TPA: iron-sulfur cluster repair di-iron protein [Flavobacteriaceae bacterium]|jgi:regulator of cell morphogenesis and NO signaling|nr:iron-sulfur cluster repair di-iron protein [Flavobacteriaceae bacterium]HJO70331.1 iron-sulfur cluster repair di-iron protein [Flavobacteriaceae bacterium]|tara:strand:- start:405 stop:1097 length:693 start_codon:yes stop_codon:yes gene_type:complete
MKEKTIADIVTADIRTASIFKRHGIDFCCGGGKILSDVCKEKKIRVSKITNDIEKLNSTKNEKNYNKMSVNALIKHIIETHHKYVKEKIPTIKDFAKKVSKVHGKNYPETNLIYHLFLRLSDELLDHMNKEEEILFPKIKILIDKTYSKSVFFSYGTILNPIKMMEMEHESAKKVLKEIEELSNKYTPPLSACNTYRALYNSLEEFQDDLHIHIHLENNILFPKVLKFDD